MRIVSYNCGAFNQRRGLDSVSNNKVNIIQNSCDILLLQETWLAKQETKFLASAIPDFVGIGEGTTDASLGPIRGHPKGGVAVFWRREFGNIVKPFFTNMDWVTGISVTYNDVTVYIFCVYLPCCARDKEDEFLSKMGELMSQVNDLDTPNILLIGDFNADIMRGTLFGKHLKNICEDNQLICSTIENLPGDSYTHISYSWHTRSWFDHCIGTTGGNRLVNNFEILYDVSDRDHLPVKFELEIGDNVPKILFENSSVKNSIKWDNVSINKKGEYACKVESAMQVFLRKLDNIKCSSQKCSDQNHISEIRDLYDRGIGLIRKVGCDTLRKPISRNRRRRPRPGWSEYVDKHHKHSILSYRAWKADGCPVSGRLYDQMKESHATYKRAVQYIKKNEDKMKKEKLANKLLLAVNSDGISATIFSTSSFLFSMYFENTCFRPLRFASIASIRCKK